MMLVTLGKWSITNNLIHFNFDKDLSADATSTKAANNNIGVNFG